MCNATSLKLIGTFVLTTAVLVPAGTATAQDANPAHAHIGHVAEAWRDTPNGEGLLPTALAEAEVAAQHASYAAGDLSDLESMKAHTGHVLHAVAPSEVDGGPGLGYGVAQAAEGVVTHIEFAAESDGASQNVSAHSTHVATSAQNTVERAAEIAALAKEIQTANSASVAAPLVEELAALADQLVAGVDANGDGQIGWQEGEGGLEQAERHLTLMMQGEDIS